MRVLVGWLMASGLALGSTGVEAQSPPDLSGVWRLEPDQSRMIGGGGDTDEEYRLTWLIDHRDPDIAIVVDLRDEHGAHEYSFRCTTDGRECVNELQELGEIRRIRAVWEDSVLVMTQTAETPHGNFTARDHLTLSGGRLIFDRTVTNERGDRSVRQVFRKLGPHPSQRQPESLPSVELPADLDRVLRDYERHWAAGNADSLVALFTADGFVARRGGWIRGEAGLRDSLGGTSSDLRLRAVSYATSGDVGYIIGNYGYGSDPGSPDRGMFILTLDRQADGRWLIAADLDGAIRSGR